MINNINFEAIASLAGQIMGVIGKPDPKGYANAVKDLHNPEGMLKILEERLKSIENDDTLSRSEKEALKDDVTAKHLKESLRHMQGSADVTDRDADNRGNLFITLLGGALAGAAVTGMTVGAVHYFQNYAGQLHIEPRITRL